MSFSSEVKAELNKMNNLANKEVVKYELLGYMSTNNINMEKNKLKFSTENEYNINRFSKLLSNLKCQNHHIEVNGKKFCITFQKLELEEVYYESNEVILNKVQIQKQELLQKAFVRGAFLGGGSINNPKNTYHLELLFSNEDNMKIVWDILSNYHIYFKGIKKKTAQALYTKDGEEISKFLAFIGANNSVLKFEEIRVYRDMRNQINRKVNCETANLSKTVNAAFKQIEDIYYLQKIGELGKMSKQLQEIAKLRIENPEASLIELGKMLKSPIGKSGVNHRLQAIQKIAEENKKMGR